MAERRFITTVATEPIICPRCTYQASSLFDLETHSANAHRGADELPAPGKARVDYLKTGPMQPGQMDYVHETGNLALTVPEADPTFWVDGQVIRFLHAVGNRTQRGEIVNVLLVGPTGTGKSSLPKEFAATWRRPFFTMHCQLVTEHGDWWGTREMSLERGTYFQKAALVDAVETPGCVILLDEANRTHPENLNSLFGFMDHRRRAWIPALHREVVVAPGVTFFVTLNEGIDYMGTNPVDKALRDRISNTIHMGYLPKRVEIDLVAKRTAVEERIARKLVEFAATVRDNPKLGVAVSTRQLLECATLVKAGLGIKDALMFAIVNSAMEDVDRKALLQSLQITGEVGEAYVERNWDDDE